MMRSREIGGHWMGVPAGDVSGEYIVIGCRGKKMVITYSIRVRGDALRLPYPDDRSSFCLL